MRFIFTAQATALSSLIQAFEGSQFSHVAAVLPGDRVIETTWSNGVRERGLSSLQEDALRYAMFEIALHDEVAAETFLREQIGKPYDKMALLGIGFGRDWQNDNAWYCSEMITTAIAKGGYAMYGADAYKRVGVRLNLEFCQGLALAQMEQIKAAQASNLANMG
jgi:uncharacterized protein YycO